jgi:hypothetical protein
LTGWATQSTESVSSNPELTPQPPRANLMTCPAKSGNCKRFTDVFMKNCKELNVPLADFCPKFEKAFYCSNFGKILGIQFDTTTLSWKLPDEKIEKTLEAISPTIKSKTMDLQSMQSLMGRLNNVSIMCPFLNGFKKPLNETLGHLQRSGGQVPLTDQGKRDLLVWAGFLLDTEKWNPISPRPAAPTIKRLEFTSDPAGAGNTGSGRIGCGNVGLNSRGEIFFATQIFWDRENFLEKSDGKGSRLKNKTTTLEMVGVLLPFLLIPGKLQSPKIIMTGLKIIPLTFSFEIDLWGKKHFVLLCLRMLQI